MPVDLNEAAQRIALSRSGSRVDAEYDVSWQKREG